MKNSISNREKALEILRSAEKRCTARTFGTLEAVEECLQSFLGKEGFAKKTNRELKNHIVTIGKTEGEEAFKRYTKGLWNHNRSQTTWVELFHNGKGWVLQKAWRGCTSDSFEIHEFDKKAYEEAKKPLRDKILETLRSETTEIHGTGRHFWFYDNGGEIECTLISKKNYKVRKFTASFYKPVEVEVSLDCEENLMCEDCEGCTGCLFCGECKDCVGCTSCFDCYECKDCDRCEECKDCSNCDWCIWCKECTDCDTCTWCEKCTECKECTSRTGR